MFTRDHPQSIEVVAGSVAFMLLSLNYYQINTESQVTSAD